MKLGTLFLRLDKGRRNNEFHLSFRTLFSFFYYERIVER